MSNQVVIVMKKSPCLMPLFLAFILMSSCSSHLKIHPDFSPEVLNGRTLAILQPQVQLFNKLRNKATPQPESRTLEFQRNVRDALADCLDSNDWTISADSVSDSLSAMLPYSVNDFDVRREHGGFDNPIDSKIFNETKIDYLLIAKGTGYQKKRSPVNMIKQMTAVDAAYNQLYTLYLEIALIDLRTGRIEWYNRNHDIESDYDPMTFAHVRRLCSKLLKTLNAREKNSDPDT